jgi:hypothetical protein
LKCLKVLGGSTTARLRERFGHAHSPHPQTTLSCRRDRTAAAPSPRCMRAGDPTPVQWLTSASAAGLSPSSVCPLAPRASARMTATSPVTTAPACSRRAEPVVLLGEAVPAITAVIAAAKPAGVAGSCKAILLRARTEDATRSIAVKPRAMRRHQPNATATQKRTVARQTVENSRESFSCAALVLQHGIAQNPATSPSTAGIARVILPSLHSQAFHDIRCSAEGNQQQAEQLPNLRRRSRGASWPRLPARWRTTAPLWRWRWPVLFFFNARAP